jgi:hypothetical protein
MTVICLDCDISSITALKGSNRVLMDWRNGRRVSQINEAGQLTQAGLDIDI